MSLELKIFNPSSLFGIHGLLMKDSKLQSAMPPLSHKLPFSPQLIERTKKRGEKGLNVVIKRGETMTKGALRGQVGQKMGRKGEEMMTKGSECGSCLDSFKTPFIPRFIVKLLTAEATWSERSADVAHINSRGRSFGGWSSQITELSNRLAEPHADRVSPLSCL